MPFINWEEICWIQIEFLAHVLSNMSFMHILSQQRIAKEVQSMTSYFSDKLLETYVWLTIKESTKLLSLKETTRSLFASCNWTWRAKPTPMAVAPFQPWRIFSLTGDWPTWQSALRLSGPQSWSSTPASSWKQDHWGLATKLTGGTAAVVLSALDFAFATWEGDH